MKLFQGSRRKAAIAMTSIAAALLVGGTAAYAFITLTATGSASSAAATVKQPTVADIVVDPMLPGTTRKVSFKLSNPNDFPIKVTTIQRSTPAVVAGGGNCDAAQLTGPLSTATVMPVPAEPIIVAGASNIQFEVPGALGLADTATGACTATFSLTVTALQQGN